MAAGRCPECGRGVDEAGFLCDRCADRDARLRREAAESPQERPRGSSRVVAPEDQQRAIQGLAAARAAIEQAKGKR